MCRCSWHEREEGARSSRCEAARVSCENRSEGLRCPAPPPRPLPHTTAGRGALFAVLRVPRGEECCFRRLRSLPLRSLVSGLSFRLSLRERASLCALVFSMSLCGLCALRGARGLFVSSLSRARASVAGLAAGRARQCAVGGPGWNWGEAGASALTSVSDSALWNLTFSAVLRLHIKYLDTLKG